MKRLYIGSINSASGKSFLTLGLGLNLKDRGLRVGYTKPLGKEPVLRNGKLVDADALFFQEALGLDQPFHTLSPFIYTIETVSKALSGRLRDVRQRVLGAIEEIKDVDILLIAGTTDIFEGSMFQISGMTLSRMPQTRAVIVEAWRGEESIDDIIAASDFIGQRLAGVVINRVRPQEMEFLRTKVRGFLRRRGVKVLGLIPDNTMLSAVTVRSLAELLGARVLCAVRGLDELVENFSIGAMDVHNALRYFRATPNKAVITGAHRSDIQMAALETSTRCIILTGGLMPDETIIAKAEERGVPILLVNDDTFSTVERIESVMGKSKIRDPGRLPLIKKVVKENLDIRALLKGL